MKNTVEFIFTFALFTNAILFIFQTRNKSTKNISLLSPLGYLLIQVAILVYAIVNHAYLVTIGCTLNILFYLIVITYTKFITPECISLEEVIEQLPEHIYWKDKEGKSLGGNTNNWKDFGLKSLTDYIGKTDYDIFPKEQAEKLWRVDQEVIRTGLPIIVDESSTTATDKGIPPSLYRSHKVPLRDRSNQIVGILGVSVDITTTRKAEIERLELLENIIALMPGHVYWVSKENIYLGCNDNQAKSAGINSRKEIVGKRNKDLPWNFSAGKLPDLLDEINAEVMRTGIPKLVEEPATLRDGSKAIFLSNKTPLYNKDNEIIGMVGISLDITEQRKIEQKLRKTEHKLAGMTLVGASIAHELRTPLASIELSTENVSEVLPQLTHAYQLAEQANLPITKISPPYLKAAQNYLLSIAYETRSAFTFIEMLLMNLDSSSRVSAIENFSIADCVSEAIARYPFQNHQRKLVQWQQHHDFIVKGRKLLVTHILFNLIKNALYHIAKSGKDQSAISIWLEANESGNILYLKDTGTGISSETLPHIFDRFFTKTLHGAGIGLTFCKMAMESMGGSIRCESVVNDYTLFILTFPFYSK